MGGPERVAVDGLVGRDRELARCLRLLDDALGGRGRVVVGTGEPGIGKTRLAEEVAAVAADHGARVVWARATDQGSSPPFGLWRLVLEQLDGPRGLAVDGASFGSAAPDLWSTPLDDPALHTTVELSASQRFELFAQLRRRLARAAEPSGLLLVLDDLQWIDEASGALLVDVARQLRGTRVLIVGTCRDGAEALPDGLAGDAEVELVALRGLSVDEVGVLLVAAGAGDDRAEDVHDRTGGNPFLVRELAGVLADGGDAPPPRVLEVTARRVAHLAPEAQRAVEAAAVAGNGFSIGVVAKVLGVPVLSLLDPLAECRRSGLVVDGDRQGEYRFAHALLRDAVVEQLAPADRRLLDGATADAIADLYAGDVGPHLADIARHRVDASVPGARDQAVAACEAAARYAADDLAHEEAVRLYRLALEVGGEEVTPADRDRLGLGLAAALRGAGDVPGWQQVASTVGRRAERDGDREALARTVLVLEGTGETAWDAELCRFSEAALLGDALPDDLTVRVLSRYARALTYRNDLDRAEVLSADARRRADLSGDPVALSEALHARQLARCGPDGTAERAEIADRMVALGRQIGSGATELWGRLWRIDTCFEAGRLGDVRGELVDVELCLDRVPGPEPRYHLAEVSATLAMATARFDDARRLAGESFDVLSGMGHPNAFGARAVVLCQVGLHIGQQASGLADLWASLPDRIRTQLTDTTNAISSVFPALTAAIVAIDAGRLDEAAALYAAVSPVTSWETSPSLVMSAWGHGLHVAIALDCTDDIAHFARCFEPFRGQHVANGAGPGVYMGPVTLPLGRAHAALGQLDAAAADLDDALRTCEDNGAAGYAVEAGVELADVLLRRARTGDADRAAALLARASAESERLGMVPFTRRIAGLRPPVGAAVARSPSRAVRAEAARSPLTKREAEVAELVRQGMTNKQIATALFISERTAENHVQHILTKLDLANRTQLATWLAG